MDRAARGGAKVQSGAELLCKSAKVNLGVGVGKPFRSRVSAVGSQVQVFGFGYRFRVLILTPCPHLYLITHTRNPRAETWDPKMNRPVNRPTGQRVNSRGLFTPGGAARLRDPQGYR